MDRNQAELYHYGIKGMKWGERKERSTGKTLRRHVVATKKNMVDRAKIQDEYRKAYDEASNAQRKEATKVVMPWKKAEKRARVDEATKRTAKAGEDLEIAKSNLNRAKRVYSQDAKKYEEFISSMQKKYGKEKVGEIQYETIKLGEHELAKVIKTRMTIANLPVIGQMYTGNYASERESEERLNEISKKAKKR